MEGSHGHLDTHEKCHIGFCTPTHTEMDSKKKKREGRSVSRTAGSVPSLKFELSFRQQRFALRR